MFFSDLEHIAVTARNGANYPMPAVTDAWNGVIIGICDIVCLCIYANAVKEKRPELSTLTWYRADSVKFL